MNLHWKAYIDGAQHSVTISTLEEQQGHEQPGRRTGVRLHGGRVRRQNRGRGQGAQRALHVQFYLRRVSYVYISNLCYAML